MHLHHLAQGAPVTLNQGRIRAWLVLVHFYQTYYDGGMVKVIRTTEPCFRVSIGRNLHKYFFLKKTNQFVTSFAVISS